MKNKHILLIEDTIFYQKIYTKKLKDAGFVVFGVETAEDGLDILEKESIDLIILDLILPQMSGFDFMKQIQKQEEYSKVPIIVVSNLSQKKDINEALSLGASDYFIKNSVTFSDVPELVKRYVPEE